MRTSSTTPTRPSSSSTPSRRRSSRGARPSSRRCARCVVFGGAAPDGLRRTGTTSLAAQTRHRPDGPTTRRAGAAGAAMIYTSGTTGKPKGALRTAHRPRARRSRCSASSNLLARATRCTSRPGRCTTRVRSRSRRSSHTLGGTDRRAAQVRPDARGSPREGAPRHQHVLRADAAEAHRVAARRTSSRRADLSSMVHADRQRGAGAVRAEAGDHREARRRLPLRGVRLDRARRRHRAASPRTSCASRARAASRTAAIEIRIVERRRHDRRAGEPGELFVRTDARDGRLPPHRRAAHRARRRASGSRSATSRTSTTRATSTSATARRT